jgi:cholesterol transport system auxiliary component
MNRERAMNRGQDSMARIIAKLAKSTALAAALAAGLSGCVSLGNRELPPTLLTLTATATAPAGLSSAGTAAQALAVLDPEAPARIDVTRVLVRVDNASLAYLKDAQWVERPTRLFGRLLADTIRAGQKRMVIEGSDIRFTAATKLMGQLSEFGYDAQSNAVVVRFDAELQQADGKILTRRFEARVDGLTPDAASIGPAMGRAANDIAAQVAAWVG